jgi:molybdopterin molybdotransferase
VTELLSLERAIALVLGAARPLPAERVPLAAAAGRVLAVPGTAVVDLPPFASSAMDGYAVHSESTPGRLPVVFRIAAGRPATAPLQPGESMAIATGGVVPEGADAVVPIEEAVEQDGIADVPEHVSAGLNVRARGGDVARGGEVVAAGVRLRPSHIGALAAAGVAEVSCGRRPRVALVTTGTELKPVGASLGPGDIYESNGAMLAAQLAAAGADVVGPVAVPDDESAHREAVERGLDLDVLVTSGGVSVGPHDLVRRIESELGVEEVFWGVALKPGKPVTFGTRGATLVFGLPGNPVSSLVGCEVFVRPALLALQGASSPGPHFTVGTLASDVRPDARRDTLVRATTATGERGTSLSPLVGQDSHMIARAAAADALVLVPRGDAALPAGTPVRYLSL